MKAEDIINETFNVHIGSLLKQIDSGILTIKKELEKKKIIGVRLIKHQERYKYKTHFSILIQITGSNSFLTIESIFDFPICIECKKTVDIFNPNNVISSTGEYMHPNCFNIRV